MYMNAKEGKIKHSLMGALAICIAIPGFFSLYEYAQIGVSDNPNKSLMKLMLFIWLIFSIVGIVLSLVGLFQKNRKKLLPFLGLFANILVLTLPLIFYLLIVLHELGESGPQNFINKLKG